MLSTGFLARLLLNGMLKFSEVLFLGNAAAIMILKSGFFTNHKAL